MEHSTLDDDTATRLLRGSLPPEEAPRGLEPVAALFRAAHGPATDDEVADPRGVVPTLSTHLRDHAAAGVRAVGARRRRKRLRRLIASPALVAALVATGAATAAAATGDLPRPVQSTVAGVASHAGLDIPGAPRAHGRHAATADADGTSVDTTPTTGTTDTTGLGPPLNGPAFGALCHAYASGNGVARGGKADATPFRALAGAATAAGESVDEYCATTTSTTEGAAPSPTTTPTSGPTTSGSDGSSRGPDAQHGPPSTLGNGAPHPSSSTTVARGNPHGRPPGDTNDGPANGNAGHASGNGREGSGAGHP